MFSNLFIGFVLGIGLGGWVYAKLQRYNGGNTQSSLIGAGAIGVLGCIVTATLLSVVF